MRRRIALVHSWADSEWASQASMRLSKEHDLRPVLLRPDTIGRLSEEAPYGIDIFVVVLSVGLVEERLARHLIEPLFHCFRSEWLIVIKDRGLERSIPAFMKHVHALVPAGNSIAALGAELAPPRPGAKEAPYSPAVVVALVVLAACIIVGGISVAWVVSRDRGDSVDDEGLTSSTGPLASSDGATVTHSVPEDPTETTETTMKLGVAAPPAAGDGAAPSSPSSPEPGIPAATILGPPHLQKQELRLRNADPLRLVYLEGGSFHMCDPRQPPPEEEEHAPNATVSGFWLGETEVTQAQWVTIMEENPSDMMAGVDDDLPVQNISWEQSLEFLNRLSRRSQHIPCYSREGGQWRWERHCDGFRLPTEAEWEYAARAGSSEDYARGVSVRTICKYGNVADRSATRIHPKWRTVMCNDGYPQLAPVKRFEPNDWGLHDMHGNVWEFVWDSYGPYPDVIPRDYTGPEGSLRVVRGGAYSRHAGLARSGYRFSTAPEFVSPRFGLRVARSGPRERVDAVAKAHDTEARDGDR